jgi:hypothetical protein
VRRREDDKNVEVYRGKQTKMSRSLWVHGATGRRSALGPVNGCGFVEAYTDWPGMAKAGQDGSGSVTFEFKISEYHGPR